MKTPLLLSLSILGLTANVISAPGAKSPNAPTADAGPDQTIYLTQTSTVTLNGTGSSNGLYQWTDISTDYKSGAVITSPDSSLTTVTGLKQGTWYYQLTVTSGGLTAMDTVVIRVDYDIPPIGGTLLRNFPLNLIAPVVNQRYDTTNYIGTSVVVSDGAIYFDRARLPGEFVDTFRGKFYSTIEDGYAWNGTNYNRSEVHFGSYFGTDSNKTYVYEWKGYFPQSIRDNMPLITGTPPNDVFSSMLAIMQWHGLDDYSPPYQIRVMHNQIQFEEYSGHGNGSDSATNILSTDDDSIVNKVHTIRVTLREGMGYPGQDAFIKVQVDGVQKYFRNQGRIGQTFQHDYIKFAGLYDYRRCVVDPANHIRNKKFSLVTESFRIYVLPENKLPVANAGTNQVIKLPQNSVMLSGSGNDTDGTIVSYQWTKISGPSSYNIGTPNSASTNISGMVQGVYQFKLIVADNNGGTGSAIVLITVNAANILPIATVDNNKSITLPANSTTIAGTGSDADGTIKSYFWTKISGPSSFNILNPGLPTTDVLGLVQGVYQFKLTVTDNDGGTGSATVQITVNAPANIPPTATVGANKSITLPSNTTSLTGSGSDADGTVASYQWTKISGPAAYNIVNPSSPVTDVTGLAQGVYQFQLSVKDNDGATGNAIMQVNVNAAANIPPTASAGPNRNITLPVNTVSLSGSGSDADGTIISYQWTKISGPSTFTITSENSASTAVNNLVQGIYQFQLTVKDDKGDVGTSTVQVTVNKATTTNVATAGVPPIASAGNDTTIVFPDNSVTLEGKGTASSGSIKSWQWSQVSGPSISTISPDNTATTLVNNLVEGTYEFELTATDDTGLIGKDTVSVTVALGRLARESSITRAYPNPVSDVITLEINTQKNNTNLVILITDMSGKTVYRKELVSSSGPVKLQIDMSNLIKGTYVTAIFFDGIKEQSVKLLKL